MPAPEDVQVSYQVEIGDPTMIGATKPHELRLASTGGGTQLIALSDDELAQLLGKAMTRASEKMPDKIADLNEWLAKLSDPVVAVAETLGSIGGDVVAGNVMLTVICQRLRITKQELLAEMQRVRDRDGH